MNTHFRRSARPNEDLPKEEYPKEVPPDARIPSRTYARFDHLEIDTDAKSVLLAFDLVDAKWLDQQGQQNPLLNMANPMGTADAWKEWKRLSPHDAPNPFESMPMYRLELKLGDGQGFFGQPSLPPIDNPRALRNVAGDLEKMWFEVIVSRQVDPKGVVAQLYPGLFSAPTPIYVRGRMPSSRKNRALSAIFSLAHLPTLTTKQLESELSTAVADLLAVYDVGQGNANALLSYARIPTHYYDLGAGVYRNQHTTPYPLAFCFTMEPPILLSHWDADHWAGAYAVMVNNTYPALKRKWIAPMQDVGPLHIAFAHDVIRNGGEFFIYDPAPGEIGNAALSPQRRIRFMRGEGADRNGTGIVLAIEEPNHVPARSWLLTGDCDYLYFMESLAPLPPVGLVAPHHGADLDKASPIPKPPADVDYKRLVYSFGPGNKHGKSVQHPTSEGVSAHNSADWDHNRWSLLKPGSPAPGGDILATCDHAPGSVRGGALIGWDTPPSIAHTPCGGTQCSIPINQS
ncbi:hypothetical protein ACKI1H_16640 [Pseudomonas sp. YH-1]|uniref:hypothetical protein n=1 Tax=Pseudomonas sp. YH-1 TaxID=3384787 RepID=UPI003F822623